MSTAEDREAVLSAVREKPVGQSVLELSERLPWLTGVALFDALMNLSGFDDVEITVKPGSGFQADPAS
ncbi:hypothetical protein ACKI10_40725 [Streptomyces galilaeus]|uniref:hypothetical protein n=1 Tax=Streptomyces galilaeus TaxID=33899 RepID=UPI0038F66C08